MEQKESYKKIFKATSLFGGVHCLNILINLVRTKLVAVLIGPEGVGLNSIYNETKEMIHEMTNCGMDQSGVRDISKAYSELEAATDEQDIQHWKAELKDKITLVRSWELLLALFGMFITIVLANPLARMTFQDESYTMKFVLLSPAVAFSTIACGEMVILKALRKLRFVALLSTINVISALVVTIPIYYLYGLAGVIPAIVAFTCACAIAAVSFTYSCHKPVISWRWKDLSHGIPMLKLGACFVLTGLMNHGMELYINSYLNTNASAATVGLYRAGYTITGTYASLLFNAIMADFYPRLSGIVDDLQKRNVVVRQQMEVLLMLVGPMTIALLIALPVLIPLLFSADFTEVIPMTRIAVFGVLLSVIYIPAAILPLASGESKVFLFVEIISTITMGLIIVGFAYGGLVGAGVGKVISTTIDTIVILMIAVCHYKIKIKRNQTLLILGSILMLAATYFITELTTGWTYWLLGCVMLIMSTLVSWRYYIHRG